MKSIQNRFSLPQFPPFLFLFCCVAALSPLSAQPLQISPQELDLGAVKPGVRVRDKIWLTNTESDELNVQVSFSGEHFTLSPTALKLPGGEKMAIDVQFSAPDKGEYTGEILLQVKSFLKTEKYPPVSLRASVVQPGLGIDPDPSDGLDMGTVTVGETFHRTLTLSNPGAVPLSIDAISLAEEGPALQVVAPGSVDLAPGERIELQIDFQPDAGGTYENRLIISSRDLTPSRLEIRLSGRGQAPAARFSPLPEVGMIFGDLPLGKTHTLDLTVLNKGQADLRIAALEISSGAFVTSWNPDTASALTPGQRLRIPVTFRPRYEGKTSAKLTLHSNDPEQSSVEIPLLGFARQTPPKIELLNEQIIDFGSVAIGKNERDHLLLWNQGGAPFTATMDLEGEAGEEFELETPSVLLQPGEFRKVSIKFLPRETGDRRATLQVKTESGQREIELQGVGKFLELTPTTLDFDQIVVGKSSDLQVEIFNFGNADFTITNVTSSDPKVFAIQSQVSPANKFVLPAQGLRPLPLNITFSPSARGVFNGVLQLQGYWDEAFETREVLVNGTGIAADIALHPAGPFEFDYVVLGEKEAQTIIATNTGDTDLEVEAHPEAPEAYVEPAAFSLKPGQSTNLKLIFTPQTLGKRTSKVRLISNAVKEKALPLQVTGKGGLDNINLERIVSVLISRKAQFDTLRVSWNNTPIVLADMSKIDLVFQIPESLRPTLIGRKFTIEWIQLDQNYDEQGGPTKLELQIQDAGESRVLAEKLNLRLLEASNKRVRLKVSTQNYPGAPVYSISQIFEAGGWKWEFEAKPLVSFLSIRPGRKYTDSEGNVIKGKTERLVGLPGFAFFGWHNTENPSISGVHLTATGNVLEALSTENSIAVSLGLSLSLYKDRFMFGLGWDVYDHRSKLKRKSTADYIMTFKYWGLF
jgi:hypothetical protein